MQSYVWRFYKVLSHALSFVHIHKIKGTVCWYNIVILHLEKWDDSNMTWLIKCVSSKRTSLFCLSRKEKRNHIYKVSKVRLLEIEFWGFLVYTCKLSVFLFLTDLFVYLCISFNTDSWNIKTESTRTLTNFDFKRTKILYRNNLKHIAFFFIGAIEVINHLYQHQKKISSKYTVKSQKNKI